MTEGKLTPDEFILAGDCLIACCPTWSWEGGDPDKRNKNLPEDKQFLITWDVPCLERAKDLSHKSQLNEWDVEEGDWIIADSMEESKVEDIDEESRGTGRVEDEVEEVGDIDDDSDDDNILAPKPVKP